MLNKAASVREVCEYFNGNKGKLPIIVDVQSNYDYQAVLDGLSTKASFLRTSDYFSGLLFPDINKMRLDVLKADINTVVLGLFQYYAFTGGESEICSAFAEIANLNTKILVISFGLKDIIEKKIANDIRLQERAQIYFVNGKVDELPKISLTTYELKNPNFYKSLRDYFIFLEDNGSGHGIIKCTLTEKAFFGSVWNVSAYSSAFDLLKNIDPNCERLDKIYGTDKQWDELFNDIKGKTLKELLSEQDVDLFSAIKKFKTLDDKSKWRLFLWLKSEPNKEGYLKQVSQNSKTVEDIVSAIYNSILNIDPLHKFYDKYYQQRKELILSLDDMKAIKEFINLSNSKGKNKVLYLTDVTEIERKEIIKCFTMYDYSYEEIQKITKKVYPLLGEYLSPFVFNNEILDNYFEQYKVCKLKNILTDDFKQMVEIYAKNRPFYSLHARAKLLSQINTDNAIVYWVDALGVEFCGLINQRCKHYGLSAKIKVARAELPTLTKYNKDFIPLIVDKSIDVLDKLKHEGVGDHDYTKTTLPLYIESELTIIDNIIKTTQAELTDKKKVIIVSDHGASRLVRIADNILTISVDTKEGEKDEKHGGRCCAWSPRIPEQYKTVTDSDNNGFCVIANYDRFKGGKYTGVELHGGATLEEVAVPIIEITNKTSDYKYILKSKELVLRGRKVDPLIISLSSRVSIPRIRINERGGFISPKYIDDTTYSFETGLFKPGKYRCSFFDDNEEIINEIEFEVKSALGGVKDLF